MTTKLEDPNNNTPRYARVRRFIRYAVVAVLLYFSLTALVHAPNMLGTATLLVILWIAGIIIYKTRHGWGGWMSSERPLSEYLKERRASRVPIVSQASTVNSTDQNITKVYDYSAADNEHMQPLSPSERNAFDAMTENFD